MSTETQIQVFRDTYAALRAEIGQVIVGQDEIVDGTLTAIFAGGHVLLEGVPGLGKTLLVRTLGEVLELSFSRIQFTPDLMPADILGTNLVMETPDGRRAFEFQRGPVFAHLILADEINRATPKTQSALLEAMQERQVTARGELRRLPEPFFVLATQNPIEQEGTYPLPEAQLDRFLFKVNVGFPAPEELTEIVLRTTGKESPQAEVAASAKTILAMQRLARLVPMPSHVTQYVSRLVVATHPGGSPSPLVNSYVRYGSSPRGAQALVLGAKITALLDGRLNVSFDDITAVCPCGVASPPAAQL
jgi:MoxR-like ATPases